MWQPALATIMTVPWNFARAGAAACVRHMVRARARTHTRAGPRATHGKFHAHAENDVA